MMKEYRVKSSDGMYIQRGNGGRLGAYHSKGLSLGRADAHRLLADWLDCGYLGKVVYVTIAAINDASSSSGTCVDCEVQHPTVTYALAPNETAERGGLPIWLCPGCRHDRAYGGAIYLSPLPD